MNTLSDDELKQRSDELAPELVLPDSGRPLRDIVEEISPLLGEPLDDFSERLRALIERHGGSGSWSP